MSVLGQAYRKLSEDGFKEFVKSTYCYSRNKKRKVKDAVLFRLWNDLGLVDFDTIYNEQYYERMLNDDALRDMEMFCEVLCSMYSPETVLELGCGTGRTLLPFHERGIEVRGVDRSSHALEISPLPGEYLDLHDLRESYNADRSYDLVLSLEVLEHIPEEYEDVLVESIVRGGDIAVVSAAPPTPPMQGKHHVNEKPREYWIEKFTDKGLEYSQEDTRSLRNELDMQEVKSVQERLMVFK